MEGPEEEVRTLLVQLTMQFLHQRLASGSAALLVEVRFGAAKHASEMGIYKGYGAPRGSYDKEWQIFRTGQPMWTYPHQLGNTCVGEITEIGEGVSSLEAGQQVFRQEAPFREEHVWRADDVWTLPDGVPWQAAVCLDPVDFALGAIRDGHVRIGDAVAVFGMGAIGLMAVQLAKLAGAHPVIAIDPLESRRKVALEVGADLVVDPKQESPFQVWKCSQAPHNGPVETRPTPLVFECVGVPGMIEQ